METLASSYVSLCSDFLKGNTGSCLPHTLESTAQELLRELSPAEVAKLQIEALKDVLSANPTDLSCLERFDFLGGIVSSFYDCIVTQLNDLAGQTEDFTGRGIKIPALQQYLEESKFMITRMARITENLDNHINRLLPCQMELIELQQISHTILQNADFGVLVINNSWEIEMLNKAASLILDIPENSAGNSSQHVFSKYPIEKYDFVAKALSEKGHCRIEATIEGTIKILEITASPFMGKKGKREGMVLIINDITLKETETKRLEENIKLATVGQLAAGVAHEIKNPLTVIKGFSQLLLKKHYEDPQSSKFLEIICQEVDRANLFIQDFLNLGKPNKPHKSVIDICTVLTDTISLIESQCFLKGIEIEQHLDCSCKVLADPHQLKQVLLNLAKNSMEAMEDSPHKKLTFIIYKDLPAQSLSISVRDTGGGIPEDILSKITNSFFTTKKNGTGLGLSISKTILDQHGGQLKFTSWEKGTTATIHLPLWEH